MTVHLHDIYEPRALLPFWRWTNWRAYPIAIVGLAAGVVSMAIAIPVFFHLVAIAGHAIGG